ncbi:MAG: hypothetical protein ACR2F6_06040 [Mycobacteriales bacterium]
MTTGPHGGAGTPEAVRVTVTSAAGSCVLAPGMAVTFGRAVDPPPRPPAPHLALTSDRSMHTHAGTVAALPDGPGPVAGISRSHGHHVAKNTDQTSYANSSDNPSGRAKNRRVVITVRAAS